REMICQHLDAPFPAESPSRALPIPDFARAVFEEIATVLNLVFKTLSHVHGSLEEFNSSGGESKHMQENHSVVPALKVRPAISTLAIVYWHFDDAQSHPRRPKDQVEVPKRIELAEIVAIRSKLPIIFPG